MTQKFYKGKEIIYSVTAVPELNTATSWKINKVELDGNNQYFGIRKIDDSHFGLTCNNNANTNTIIFLYIDIVDEHQNIDETRRIYLYWYGTYVAPDKVISTYDKANLLSVAVLRNYATYNITEKMNSSFSGNVFGGINIDPEKDTPIPGLRLSQFNDYDDEYNLGTKQNAGKFVQNPNFPNFSFYPEVINDNGEFKITIDSKRDNNTYMYDLWFNNVDSQANALVPPMIPNPTQSYYNYPIIGPNSQLPYLMGLKVEVAPDVFLYCNQYNDNDDFQVLFPTIIDKSDRNIYKDVEFRDENDNLIPNTDTIGVMLKTKNFILKSTRNIRKVRIWTVNGDMATAKNYSSSIDADKGTIKVVDKCATYTGSDTSSFPSDQFLHIWEGNSKHIKFSLENSNMMGGDGTGITFNDDQRVNSIHSYTQNNQTSDVNSATVNNPKLYLCDSNGDPTSNYYDGTLHRSCWWDVNMSTGDYNLNQFIWNNNYSYNVITLIQVETD
jgi:hypothetical protein